MLFTEDADDPKYKYGSFIDVKETPEAFRESLKGEFPAVPKPMLAEVENVNSIVRILIPLSLREGVVFPLAFCPWQLEPASPSSITMMQMRFQYYSM